MGNLAAVPGVNQRTLPGERVSISGNFGFGSDDMGDPQGWLSYTASDSLPEIRFIGTDAGGNVTHVFLNGVPWQFEGTFTGTSCGFGLLTQTPDNSQIDRIWFNLAPNESARSKTTSSGHTTPGCPESTSDSTKDPGSTMVDVLVRDIPGGRLDAFASTGKAGRATVQSDTGPIGSVAVAIVTSGGDTPSTLTFSAKNVALRTAEWDFDGDTRYTGNPIVLFVDSGGTYIRDLRVSFDAAMDEGHLTVGIEPGSPVAFHDYQLRIYEFPEWVPLVPVVPHVFRAGVVCYNEPSVTPFHVEIGPSSIADFLMSFDAQQPIPTPSECPFPSPGVG